MTRRSSRRMASASPGRRSGGVDASVPERKHSALKPSSVRKSKSPASPSPADDDGPLLPVVSGTSRERKLTFVLAYAGFLAPIIASLVYEKLYGTSYLIGTTIENKNPLMDDENVLDFVLNLCIWLGFLAGTYTAVRNLSGALSLKRKIKTHANHMDDLIRFLYTGCAIAIMTGWVRRNVWMQLGLAAYQVVFFTVLFELMKNEVVQLSSALLDNPIALAITAVGATTLTAVVYSLFHQAYLISVGFFQAYCLLFLLGLVVHLFAFVPHKPIFGIKGRHHLHIHHSYWPLPFVHMCVFNSDVSVISQSIFIGIWIHGVLAFGIEPLFYDSHEASVA